MGFEEFYDSVHDQEPKFGPGTGSIQWKGTDVCLDGICVCGAQFHFDGDFFYYYYCTACGRTFAVGRIVKLIELTPEQVESGHATYPKTAEIWQYVKTDKGA